MKFLKPYKVQHSTKLFQNKYKYKIVFTSGVAGWFRGSSAEQILAHHDNDDYYYARKASPSDKTHAKKLAEILKNLEDWGVRVETPFVSLYLNNDKDLETVVNEMKLIKLNIEDLAWFKLCLHDLDVIIVSMQHIERNI